MGDGRPGLEVVETNVDIKTPDGTCDAAFFHPPTGSHPGVIIWPDAFGLRPVTSRDGQAPGRQAIRYSSESVLSSRESAGRRRMPRTSTSAIRPARQAHAADGIESARTAAVERDAPAFVAWLDSQRQVDRSKKIGTQGYCMGGPLVMRTAAAVPNRIGAGGSFHGGGLVTANPNSPHLLAPKIKAHMYFGVAANDDAQQPDAKTKLKEAFEAVKVPAEIEVYSQSQHGWCISDMPKQASGQPIYNKADADRAWAKLLALYKAGLS